MWRIVSKNEKRVVVCEILGESADCGFFCMFVLELLCVKFAIYHAEKIFRNFSELIDIIRKTRIFLKDSRVITRLISRLLHVRA